MTSDGKPGGAGSALPDTPAAIRFENVRKVFTTTRGPDELAALNGVSFSVEPARFVAILGPSGCGKTTVLRIADGLVDIDGGEVEVFGAAPRPGPEIGFVFQTFRLIPWATVLENVDFALKSTPLGPDERRDRALRYLDLVGLSRFAASYPRELSGGMKQRVALARALAPEPGILLMDEPFASIDAQTRELMQVELMRLWMLNRPVVLFVTHSVDEAIVLADRILLMGPRPGRVVETIEVDLERPRWAYDARAEPRYVEMRSYLSVRMRDLVLSDPSSEFYGRDILPRAGA